MMIEVLILIVLLALSALSAMSEIAFFSLSNIKVRKLVRMRKTGAGTLKKLKSNPHRVLVTLLIWNNLVNTAAAAYAAIIATNAFGSQGVGIATGIMTFLILVFGDVTPKSFGHQNAEKVALFVAHPLYIISYVMYPFIFVVENISKGILRLLGVRKVKDQITEDELMAALSLGTDAGVIDKEEEEMMQNVIEFGESRVAEVMTPLKDMAFIGPKSDLSDVLTKMLETRYSRIPVYEKSQKKVLGVVNLRGILKHIKKRDFSLPVSRLMEQPLFVKEGDILEDAFDKLKLNSAHMAVVMDAQKRNVRGLVTMEDMLEEIVGEIYDESDRKRYDLRHIDRKTAVVNGDMSTTDVRKKLGVPLQSDTRTIADIVSARMNGKPAKGSMIKLRNFILTVMSVDSEDPSKIKSIKIYKRRGRIQKK